MGMKRQTVSYKILWEQFEQSKDALSVVDLVKRLSECMNKTTVYRILDRLEEDGELHSFAGKDGLKWYAKCHDCSAEKHIDVHPHFQCNHCGNVECLTVDIQIPQVSHHKIEKAQILLLGQCGECAA